MGTKRLDFLIVGAGPAGLGAAYRLHRLGSESWLVVEGQDGPGGLSRSWRDEAGFTWDLGGHIVFSKQQAFNRMLEEVLPGGLLRHERRAYVRLGGRDVPYPLQNNLHRLPDGLREECLRGLEEAAAGAAAAGAARPADFAGWAEQSFGPGVVRHFLKPYNRKLWRCELEELSADWVGERVARPDPAKVLAEARAGRDDVGWGPNSAFLFPRAGGTGAIWSALAGSLPSGRVRFGAAVAGIDLAGRTCRLASGEELAYENLVATLPLDELAAMTGDRGLISAASALRRNCVDVFGLGLAGRPPAELAGKCWMYFPEERPPYYRVTVFSHYSPANVPDPDSTWSLMAEVSSAPGRPAPEPAWLGIRVVDSLKAERLMPADARVLSQWHRRAEHAYPLPTVARNAALAAIVPPLEDRGVWPRGRFGAWRYEAGNMDHCFMQGVEVVGRICRGEPETVLPPSNAGAAER